MKAFIPCPLVIRWVAVLVVTTCRPLLAADDSSAARPMVEIESQFVQTTDEIMRTALGTAPDDHLSIGRKLLTREEVDRTLTFLKTAGATFLGAPRAITMNGQRALIESVRELPYPTKFEKVEGEPGKFVPTDFETRNVGVSLEFEAVVSSGNLIDLTLAPSIVNFLGFIDYASKQPAPGSKALTLAELLRGPLKAGGFWQPVFTTQKLSSAVEIPSDSAVLLGSIPLAEVEIPEGPDSKKPDVAAVASAQHTFIFVSARVLSK